MTLVDSGFSLRLTEALLHFLWQGCLVGLLAASLGRCLKSAPASWRYNVNVAGLVLMLACVPLTFFLVGPKTAPVLTDRQEIVTPAPPEEPRLPQDAPAADVAPAVHKRPITQPATTAGGEAERAPIGVEVGTAGWRAFTERFLNWARPLSPFATAAYLAGVSLMLLRLTVALWGGYRLGRAATVIADRDLLGLIARQARRMGLAVAPVVAWCERVSVPVVVGIFKPMVLLPAAMMSGLAPDQLAALVAHELAHIRRFDLLVNLLQRFVEALLFYHPAVWWLSRRVSVERENCCDDCVVRAGWGRVEYAEALLRMAEVSSGLRGTAGVPAGALLSASGDNPSQFKRRVMRLLRPDDQLRLGLSCGGLLACVGLALLALLALPIVRGWAGGDEEPGAGPARHGPTGTQAETAAQSETGTIIRASDGQPAADVEIVACRSSGQVIQRLRSDATGGFPVEPAWWEEESGSETEVLLVAREGEGRIGWFDFQNAVRQRKPAAEGDAVEPREQDRPRVRITLVDLDAKVTGRLVGPDGQPAAGVRVQSTRLSTLENGYADLFGFAVADELPFPQATSDADGRFKLRVPGKATVGAHVLSHDWVTHEINGGAGETDQLDLGTVNLERGGRIAGQVTASGKPLAGVQVAARGLTSDGRVGGYGYCFTDAEGRYTIGGLRPEFYKLQTGAIADRPRLVSAIRAAVEVTAGKSSPADFALIPGRRVHGRVVVAESGKPVSGAHVIARVSLVPNDHSVGVGRVTRAAADGSFELFVPPGLCDVYATVARYAWHTESRRMIEVTADDDPEALDLIVAPPTSDGAFAEVTVAEDKPATERPQRPTLTVELRTKSPRPIGDHIVRLVYERQTSEMSVKSGPTFEKEFRPDEMGRQATLLIDVPGYTPTATPPFTVAAQMPPLVVELEPAAYVPVRGLVVASGKPVADARVRVRRIFHGSDSEFPWGVETKSDPAGQFVLRHLRAGERVTVHASKTGVGERETDAFVIVAGEAIELEPLIIGIADQTVSGVVTDQDALPVAEATVAFAGEPRRETTTDAEGRFRLEGLPPGRLQLSLKAPDGSTAQHRVLAGTADQRLFLPLQSLYDRPEHRLVVALRTPDGKPPAQAQCFVLDLTERRWLMSTSPENPSEVAFDLCTPMRRTPDHQLAVMVFAAGHRAAGPVEIVTQPAIEPVAVTLTPASPAALSGRVLDAEGRPLAGVTVGLSLSLADEIVSESWRYISARIEAPVTDAAGRFTLPDLHAGSRVAVYVNKEGFSGAWSERVAIGEAGGVTLPDLTLAPATRTVAGQVTGADGRPIAGARVRVHDFSRPRTNTDAEGRFILTGVPEGDLLLSADAPGYDSAGDRFTVAQAAAGVVLTLPLDPAQFTSPAP